jgi:DNA-binding CsgD family transcriptional regulator
MLYEDPKFLKELEAIAQKITRDYHQQKVLVHIARIHVWQLEPEKPSEKRTWYLKGCKNRMLNWLGEGCSVDSPKRRYLGCDPLDAEHGAAWMPEGLISKECVLAAVSANDLVSVVSARLRPRERSVLEALAKGFTDREIAAELGITRQAVAKHREKIQNAFAIAGETYLAE